MHFRIAFLLFNDFPSYKMLLSFKSVPAPFRNVVLCGFSSEGLEFDSRLCIIIIKLSEN